jgi:hypothetical protein
MSAQLAAVLACLLFPPVTIGVLLFLVAMRDAWRAWRGYRKIRDRYRLQA